MPPSCLRFDPVELLLRSILRRSLVLGAAAAAACSGPIEHEVDDASADTGVADASSPSSPAVDSKTDGALEASDSVMDAGRDAGRPDDAGRADTVTGPSDSATPAPDGALGPALACDDASSFAVQAAGLKPAAQYDYLAIRQRSSLGPVFDAGARSDGGPESWTEINFRVESETGTKCATAQGGACAEQLAHHPAQFVPSSCLQLCNELSVVTTRGNEVRRWVGEAELKALLGPVDSADDALLLVNNADYFFQCDRAEQSSWRAVPEGYEVFALRTTKSCMPIETTRFRLRVSTSGEISVLDSVVVASQGGCAGRKPAGLLSSGRELGRSKFGDYLANMAHLEAASVISFERLARELAAFAAPQRLIDAALASRADEVRHAEIMGRLALGHRGELVEPEVAATGSRTLEEIALENAVEGCVRETYGALVGGHQAQHALNRSLRSVMVRIAQDEARHASLSHQVHRWITPRLSHAARERVRHAQQRAVFALAAEVAIRPDVEVASLAGLPGPEVGRVLLAELSKTLWRSALRQRRAGTALG